MDPLPIPGQEPHRIEPLLGRLLAIADDAVIVTDDRFRIVLFNRGAEQIFGYPVEQVLGRPLVLLLPESMRASHDAHMTAFGLEARTARRIGERAGVFGRRADGSEFEAEASITHQEIDGRTYYAAILRDVSRERRARRELVESELRFRALAQAAPVGIFQCDAGGRIVYVNERWSLLTGLSSAEAAGEGWQRALHPADRVRLLAAWQSAAAQQAPFELRCRFVRPDGSEALAQAHVVPTRSADGEVGLIGVVADITESHAQAQALERAMSEAEAAVRAKSLFLANMSHEIRTPLNAVIGMTTLLLDTPMSEDQQDFARTIRASGETLLEIINDILDYSKADVGKLEIEQQPFDLRRCVEDSLDLVTPRALEKGLNLAYMIDDDTPEALVGDATRVRQILVNLLSNAVKFTHQGKVLVTVDGEALDEETHRIHFAVKDSGIGIAAEHLPRLFQSFSQVDASTTRKYGGTGLGLAISKRLAELMGGAVDVESEPGHGSTFHVFLRVRVQVQPGTPDHLRRDAPALAGKRILIVDDNLTNRRILTRLALRWGMLPSTLPSALEALDRIRHGEGYDVALLDMSMPEVDGLDLAAEIRRRRGPDDLPIVLLTSLGHRASAAAGPDLALAASLSKPIKAEALFDALVAAVERRGLVVPGPVPRSPLIRRPLRVLVAEDNSLNQRVALRLLGHLGHGADLAANGLEVLQALERVDYDLVLMDIQMPEMDGLQAARVITQRRPARRRPRLIAMTANAMPGDREAYLAAGMDGYIAKPIRLEELAAALAPIGASATRGDEDEAPAEAPIDSRRLEHLRAMQDDSQPSLVRELIDLFSAESTAQVERVAEALQAGSAPMLRAAAHRFLSVTQNIGATRMSALCEEIERLARQGQVDQARPLLIELRRERELAHQALAAARLRY